ncbi:MAG TPA: hypothetical protein VFH44_06570 [Solirubrobacterales bacterium]|nr:hypothetical protein [Solirubrobacterales bacterium]
MSGDRAEQAGRAVAAINAGDPELIGAAFDPLIEIRVGRSVHTGIEAAIAWARRKYDHLEKRYTIAATHARGNELLALGSVEYVWREEGEVGDSSPIALRLAFADDRVRRLTVEDDPEAALDAFESSTRAEG